MPRRRLPPCPPRIKLIQAREKLGLDRTAFAARVGISPNYVWYIEMGRRGGSPFVRGRWLAALGSKSASIDLFDSPQRWPRTAAMLSLSGEG